MVQKFTSEFRCEIFVLRSERRVSNYFVSIIMACELGEGGVPCNRYFNERVENSRVLGCKLRTLLK